jgi:peptide/nickel transport system permease protein
MLGYIVRRFIRMAVVLWVVTFFLFLFMRWLPGDIAAVRLGDMATPERLAALRHELGTDRPLMTQYWDWFSGIFRGDFGQSLMTGESVGSIIKRSLPITLELSLMAWIIGSVIGVIPGIICAVKQDTLWDYSIRVVTIVLLGVPSFWLALLALVYWWTPPLIYKDFLADPLYNLKQFILPALCISIGGAAFNIRMIRSCMLEVLRQDYIRTARSKGLSEGVVIGRHAWKNAFIPLMTVWGMGLAGLIAGAVIMEQIFGLPGMGRASYNALVSRDYPVVQGTVLFIAAWIVLMNLFTDLMYGYVDPRIRLAGK